ncbi:acetyl esterase/lipase [Rubricella aquisinus]|uniref:Acetyl esterase/lipase n=1 Tax=Rubricella aquisinus TaxID=2028108 RepID=A0A840WP16_9RHOB|nr:alpha/beta hydrolase [Rubricella aquisinus]MBB5516371.1 acetyl esterase/lipase [Rubricella aquisinus]
MLTIDPKLFHPSAISEETAAFLARLEAQLADLPATNEMPVEETRAARDAGQGVFPSGGPLDGSEWRDIPGGRVRISPAPGTPRALYLHIHGGGWALGRPSHFDKGCQRLAAAAGVTVVSVEYRLAPEHPWPACRDDCLNAALWLLEHGVAEFGTDQVLIGGESAGGHLTAVTALALKERGLADRLAGLVLNYGLFDLRLTGSMRNWGTRKLILNTPVVEWFADMLDPGAAHRGGPGLSPLLADVSDMPPALFQIGTADPLLDDTLLMAAHWAGAGNETSLAVYPGGVHAFDAFDLEIAREYHARLAAFVSGCLR